jgi:hypothetical protein
LDADEEADARRSLFSAVQRKLERASGDEGFRDSQGRRRQVGGDRLVRDDDRNEVEKEVGSGGVGR